MRWLKSLRNSRPRRASNARAGESPDHPLLGIERLESRTLLDATAVLAGTALTITGGANKDMIDVAVDPTTGAIVVLDAGRPVATFAAGTVTDITINAGAGNDVICIAPGLVVTGAVTLNGEDGDDVIHAGNTPTTLNGGNGNDKLIGGLANDVLTGGPGNDFFLGRGGVDTLNAADGEVDKVDISLANYIPFQTDTLATSDANDIIYRDLPVDQTLTAAEVTTLLQRAAAASASTDAIIAIVDRQGNILGVRVEGGVSPAITGSINSLVFAIDGAVAKARTGAFFGNNQAPLTSRTVQFISQSTITQREVESNPSAGITGGAGGALSTAGAFNASTVYGPGWVAPVGPGGHFPPNIQFTPQVDLFGIEHTNRDNFIQPGVDTFKNTGDDLSIASRFNATFLAGRDLPPPISYGDTVLTAANQQNTQIPHFLPRGIATLPGGIPIYKNGQVVGGIGVFFPGTTGFATEENSVLSTTHNPNLPDRSLEAEWIAFAAAGGSSGFGFPIGAINGAPALPGFDLPSGRIDLVGITLDIFGPGGVKGPQNLVNFGLTLGFGNPNSASAAALATANAYVEANGGAGAGGPDLPVTNGGASALAGLAVPTGLLVDPGAVAITGGLTQNDVLRIINQAIQDATETRAAIRTPAGVRAKFVIAITDLAGNIVGLFRQPDATVFSVDVAVAKARNVTYYADSTQLQPIDMVEGVPPGTALTNRTFRYLAEPRFPEGIDGQLPGPFSIFLDGGSDIFTALSTQPALATGLFDTVLGFDSFHPSTNFRQTANLLNQNGIVFFPGSMPLYKDTNGDGIFELVGGLGISGDGVDQDDVTTFSGATGFAPPLSILRADQTFVRGVRLPFQKFNRNPHG